MRLALTARGTPGHNQGVHVFTSRESQMPKDLTNVPTANLAAHFDGLIAV